MRAYEGTQATPSANYEKDGPNITTRRPCKRVNARQKEETTSATHRS